MGEDGLGGVGRGGVFCGISIIFIYIFTLFTYLYFYSVSVAVLWLFILLFLLWVPYPPIFFVFFLCLSSVSFGAGLCCIST